MLFMGSVILGTIGIGLGIVLGMILSFILIQGMQIALNNLANDYVSFNIKSNYFHIIANEKVKLKMVMSIPMLLMAILIIYAIVFVSSILPMRKINKIAPIEAIRGNNIIKIKRKNMKTTKFIPNVFKEEGTLAWKNIKREKSKYRTIVMSLTCSIVLFLVVSSFITNLFKFTDWKLQDYKYDYYLSFVPREEIEEILDFLNKDNIINSYVGVTGALSTDSFADHIIVPQEKISKTVKKAIKSGVDLGINESLLPNGDLKISTYLQYVIGDAYQEILKKAGVTELKEGEIIISNTAVKKDSKYGDKINYTNLKKGDIAQFEKQNGETIEYKIAGVVDDFVPYIHDGPIAINRIEGILGEEDLKKEEDIINSSEIPMIPIKFDISIDTDYPEKIDERMKELNEIRKNEGKTTLYGRNGDEIHTSNKTEELSTRAILQIPLYAFVRINFIV